MKKAIDMTTSPRPWRYDLTPSIKGAVVRGADGSVVCVCHPGNASAICEAVNRKGGDK